jgi:signal transduction histidine kinase
MQDGLVRQEKARRTFVATASHELRTPLTLLSGMLELLDDDLREGRLDLEDAREQIEGAQRQLRRLEHLASDLLDLSRLDSEAPLRSEPVELGELSRAVGAEFALRAIDRGIEVDVVPPIAPCWAQGDPGAVARIVRILLDNALRFAPEGSPVVVVPAYHGSSATVEVHDEGPGVPDDERERIFERFQRGSRTGGEEGFGLGLAIGRELAHRLGGRLELVDDGRDGATFRLSLPIELPAGSHRQPETVA